MQNFRDPIFSFSKADTLHFYLCLFRFSKTYKSPDVPTSSTKTQDMAAKQNSVFLFGGHHCLLNTETPQIGFVLHDTAKCQLSLSSEDLDSETGYASPALVRNWAPKTTLLIHFKVSSFVFQYTNLLPGVQD